MAEIILPPDHSHYASMHSDATKFQGVSVSEVKTPFVYPVDWPADGQWHTVDEHFAQVTGITTYRVKWTVGDLIGSQSIDFITNNNNKYQYNFVDADDHTYEVEVQSEDKIQHTSRISGNEVNITQISGTQANE